MPKLREIKEPEWQLALREVKIKRRWKEIKFEKSGTIKGSESEILPALRLENSKLFSIFVLHRNVPLFLKYKNEFRKELRAMEDRDISEQVALGVPTKKSGGDALFDQRLFGQSKGMDSGFDRMFLRIVFYTDDLLKIIIETSSFQMVTMRLIIFMTNLGGLKIPSQITCTARRKIAMVSYTVMISSQLQNKKDSSPIADSMELIIALLGAQDLCNLKRMLMMSLV